MQGIAEHGEEGSTRRRRRWLRPRPRRPRRRSSAPSTTLAVRGTTFARRSASKDEGRASRGPREADERRRSERTLPAARAATCSRGRPSPASVSSSARPRRGSAAHRAITGGGADAARPRAACAARRRRTAARSRPCRPGPLRGIDGRRDRALRQDQAPLTRVRRGSRGRFSEACSPSSAPFRGVMFAAPGAASAPPAARHPASGGGAGPEASAQPLCGPAIDPDMTRRHATIQ